jgi:ABC-type dipeptide/oligopeptide/nickel transport system permease subunit
VAQRFGRNRLAVASLAALLVVVFAALAGGALWRWDHGDRDPGALSSPPSMVHPMGTDGIGRDVLAQVLEGAQQSVLVALVVAMLSTVVGTLVGALAGYARGPLDAVLMRLTDVALVVPGIAVFALLAGSSGGDWLAVAVVIALFSWMSVARVVRGVVLSLREQGYVEAARALGAGPARIVTTHLLPNAAGPVIVSATLAVAVAILAEAGLSYLGLGIQPPDVSLGLLIDAGQQAARTRPWLFYFPGAVIVVICLCVNFVGDGLRDAFDPTSGPP